MRASARELYTTSTAIGKCRLDTVACSDSSFLKSFCQCPVLGYMALAGGAFETVWWSARSCLSTCENRVFFCIASGWIHSKVWFPRQSVEAPIRLYRSYGEWFEAGLQADLAFVWLFLPHGFCIFLFVSFSELSQVTSCFCRLLCPTSLLRRLRPELMNAGDWTIHCSSA